MPCLFLCHTSGLKLFPGGRVLLRPSSNAGLHSRYLLQPSTNDGPLPSSNAGMYSKSLDTAELSAENAVYRAGRLHPSFMPDYFRDDAPPRAWADCLRILFPIDAIYLLTRYIASSPQGFCRPKISRCTLEEIVIGGRTLERGF